MATITGFLPGLCIVACLLAAGCSEVGISEGPHNNVPEAIEVQAQRLSADLEQQGYEVNRGYFKLLTTEDADYSYRTMGSCYGNNPAAPYVVFAVPPWPEEFVDPATKLALGLTYEGYDTLFRLDPREAIVIFGQLPPDASYFGMQTYLFSREGTFDTGSAQYIFFATYYPAFLSFFFATVPDNPARIQVFNSLGNSNNNAVIVNQSGAAFDQERFFIITPDQFMNDAIRQSLAGISVADENIFTEPIPPTVLTGLDEHADDFAALIRYAEPLDQGTDGTPSALWRQDLPLVVLRVRDTRTERTPVPYEPLVLETRTATDESWLTDDLNNLVAEICTKWGLTSGPDCVSDFLSMQTWPVLMVGPIGTEIGMNCLGDTQDTSYHGTPNLSLDNGEIYAVVSTLGTETDNASYVGLSVNESLKMKGIANISSKTLTGTAAEYGPTVNNTDKFYVYYFARDCSDLQIITSGHCFTVTEEMIPPGDYLKLAQRNYLRPGTQRGPDSSLILTPKLIKLKRP